MEIALLLALLVHAGLRGCEEWCHSSCIELNGNVQLECGACPSDGPYLCFEGADGWADWEQRREAFKLLQVGLDANGGVTNPSMVKDAPIERTKNSLVYAMPFYALATRHRDAEGLVQGMSRDVDEYEERPLPVPQPSPRRCEIHSCELIEGDHHCTEGRAELCHGPKGHLRPIGEQFHTLEAVREHDQQTQELSAPMFWQDTVAKVCGHAEGSRRDGLFTPPLRQHAPAPCPSCVPAHTCDSDV